MTCDAQEIIDNTGSLADEDIDLGVTALALAALDQEGISLERYVHHLKVLAEEVGAAYLNLVKDGTAETAELKLKALIDVIGEQHGYIGDNQSYDDLQNASLIRVIERSKGIPITLSILYICAARVQGWDVCGLNVPGHFVCRIEHEGQRIIFDPFHDCKVLEAQDLRVFVKRAVGERAELSADYFEPASNRDILARLQNNIKLRQIDAGEYSDALVTVLRMLKVDPNAHRLLWDAGVLYAKAEQNGAAIQALESYLEKVPKAQVHQGERHEIEMLLAELRGRLN